MLGSSTRDENEYRLRFLFLLRKLLCRILNSNNLLVSVIAASLANTESKVVLAALRALYKVGRSIELPYARASLHLSCMRYFSLRNCHC